MPAAVATFARHPERAGAFSATMSTSTPSSHQKTPEFNLERPSLGCAAEGRDPTQKRN